MAAAASHHVAAGVDVAAHGGPHRLKRGAPRDIADAFDEAQQTTRLIDG
jgi:hypothetical protein